MKHSKHITGAKIKHKQHKPSLKNWNLEAWDKIAVIIQEATEEAVRLAFEDEETFAYFPVEWAPDCDGNGGKCPKDPLTVYLCVALDNGDDEKPTYEINLREILNFTLESSGFDEGIKRLSCALREWADEIDETMKRNALIDEEFKNGAP